MSWFRTRPNFGDALSPLVMQAQTGMRPKWVRPSFAGKVLAVGSILHYLEPGDLVIGSGLIKPDNISMPNGVRVLSLRGPLTAEILGIDPSSIPLGDPGLLASKILGVAANQNANMVSVIPHYWEKQETLRELQRLNYADRVNVIDAQQPPLDVIRAIAESRVCVSTSLHGLIVAESMGIPALWAEVTGKLIGGTFKFNDYYLGTGRTERRPIPLSEALEAAFAKEYSLFTPDDAPIRRAMADLNRALRGA